MIGALVAERYEVLAAIGAGGVGRVYRAHDRLLARDVALKVVADVGPDGSRAGVLRHEARVLASLRHPGIVTVHDLVDHEGSLILVMELVGGCTLSTLITSGEPGIGRSATIMLAVAEALAYAHSHGVLHRDLSLDNILVDDAGGTPKVVLIDFGLGGTEIPEAGGTGGELRGTPRYLAPEQIQGGDVGIPTEVYAFGVCLFRMLGGRFPFSGDYLAALCFSIQYDEPAALPPTVPGALAGLARQCLAKDPGARPNGFAAIITALAKAAAAAGDEPGAPAPSAMAAATATAKRNPYLNRVMIADAREFFGRERELRRIFSRLDAPQPQSIAIVGDRRIGKSSLLNHVHDEGVRRQRMQRANESVFVYLDFQGQVAEEEGRFLQLLLDGMPVTCRPARAPGAACSFADLEEAVARLHGEGRRLLVLMDEFDRITQNGRFTQSFFSYLRSLANRFKVAYVTASYAELQALCHARQIADSPFFNIFSNLPLGPLEWEEADALISGPSAEQGVPLGPHAQRLLDHAGRRPMYLQIACSCMFDILEAGRGAAPDWNAFRAAYGEECQPHYSFAWGRLTEQEQRNLVAIASGREVERQHAHLNGELRQRGLLIEAGGGLKIESEAFRGFILEQEGPRPRSSVRRFWRRG